MKNILNKIGVEIPTILLPAKNVEMSKWAVVACDQYTSQPEYWTEVEKLVDGSSSTLKLIFPEVYLEDEGKEERINKINTAMKEYIKQHILVPQKPGFVFIDRKTSNASSRKGLILSIDLEKYEFCEGSQSLIRATEGTVIDRLPPRVKVRENASLELPHIMVLIDDPNKTVIEPIAQKADTLEKLYDFEMMMNGGHIKGYKVDDDELIMSVLTALEKLGSPENFNSKYKLSKDSGKGVLLFAVGDGNHSLASAKVHWQNVKQGLTQEEALSHPARYALVELVNVHDSGLEFEPIHRVVFNINVQKTLDAMMSYYNKGNTNASYKLFENADEFNSYLSSLKKEENKHQIPFVAKDTFGVLAVETPSLTLEVGTLQAFLDEFLKTDMNIKIDYIHGDDVVNALGTKEENIGFFLPPMDKNDLFKTVILDGILPRKTFSMGDAEEKRFYLECRKIVKE